MVDRYIAPEASRQEDRLAQEVITKYLLDIYASIFRMTGVAPHVLQPEVTATAVVSLDQARAKRDGKPVIEAAIHQDDEWQQHLGQVRANVYDAFTADDQTRQAA